MAAKHGACVAALRWIKGTKVALWKNVLGSLTIGYQPFRLGAMFRCGYIEELASHFVESVATTSSPCLGELKLLEIVS